ncbi:MAG: T9SS type A sorting domain-containing protein [Bacteroidota bacterium]
MLKPTLITALLLLCFSAFSQNNTFVKTYGVALQDVANDVAVTNNGYVVAGYSFNTQGNKDALLMLLDNAGNSVWTKRYTGAGDEVFTQVTLANDGGFLAVGNTNSVGQGGSDLMVVKIDNNGNAVWRRTFGNSDDESGETLGNILKVPGGYVISGVQYGFTDTGLSGTGIVRLDNQGNTVWSRSCNSDGGWDIVSCTYMLGDTIFAGGGADGDACLLKINANNGNFYSAVRYAGAQNEALYHVFPTYDGNLVLSDGTWTPSNHTELWCWINKTDRNGNYIWSKVYQHAGTSLRGGAIPVADGGYVLTPFDYYDTEQGEAVLAKMDGSGNLLWSYQYGGANGDRLFKTRETSDGGLVAVGHTRSVDGTNKILVVRTDANGRVIGCCPRPFELKTYDYYPDIVARSFTMSTFANGINAPMQSTFANPAAAPFCASAQPTISHNIDLAFGETFPINGVPYTAPDTVYSSLPGNLCDTLVVWNLKLKIDTITGIVNIYTPVFQINCNNSLLTVGSTAGFAAGDKVLLIQMQGATVDLTNTQNFGDILDPGYAGNYEFNRVASVSGNTVQLQFALTRPYDVAGRVQLIRVPEYFDVSVSNLTCKPWNGVTGGVLAIDVKNQLVLNGNMDVSGKGFRGGLFTNDAVVPADQTDYYYPPNPSLAAAKGEGIAIIPMDKSFGRGKAANGGGGGNSVNAGGGGGSNAGKAGDGGLASYNTPGSPTPGTNGLGGQEIYPDDAEHILMGGGGGAGQANNNHGSAGGNGGGIIFLNAKKIQNSGFQLLSKGEDAIGFLNGNQANDGQGGGGAGGSIVLTTEAVTGQLNCIATGGKGGDCLFFVTTQIMGPGGGGGGGKVLSPNGLTGLGFDVKFGLNGIANQNLTNGAQAGEPGSKLGDFTIAIDTSVVAPIGPIDLNIVNPTCAAPKSGAITILNAPGALYSLNNGAFQNNPVFSGLSAGSYHVSVKQNDCYTKDTLVGLNLQITFYTTSDTFALCPTDTIYINGVGYSQPGVFVDTLPGLNGCDTIARYTIVRGMSPAITQTLSFCPGDSVTINGHVYTQPGTAVSYFIPAQVGCDTLVTWFLEWAPQPTVTKNIAFCPGDNVLIDGVTYNQPDTIQGVIPAVTGCDTLATYILRFATQPSITKNISFCPGDSVVIDGVHYAQPGTVSGVIPATTGCDTLATYVLSFATQPSITKNLAFCPGDFIVIDGIQYTQPGTVHSVIPATVGCDTLATYLLSFAPQPTTTDTIAFCPGDSVSIHGQVYNHPGIVTIHLPASSGCDTIATYVLKYALPNTPTHILINCPLDIYVDADPGDTVQTVTYSTPTANTDCPCPGLSLQLQQGLPSGSLFHLGETNMCYAAKDSCGNSITCCFKVTVTESAACDVKEIGCVKFELLGITADAQQRKTYRIRVTNKCAQKLSYAAIQLPTGIVADLPLTNTMYAAPSGREYSVRNPNYSPIYSVRFAAQTDSIFGGQSDIFKYTLPAQADPTYINVKVRLEPQVYYETHLNVFNCVVEYAPNNKTASGNRNEGLNLYPNPSGGLLNVDWTHLDWQPSALKIYNSQGQMIESRSIQPDVSIEQIILPEKMTEGLYLLEIQSFTGQKESRKFMYKY